MGNKHMKELIAVIITLGLIALIVTQQSPKNTYQAIPPLSGFVLQDVAELAIHIQDKPSLAAKKEGLQWRLMGSDKTTYLNVLAVDQLLHDLQTMQVKRIASRNKDTFARFAVAENQVVLKDNQGQVLLDVFIGKPATDLTNTYIRLADAELVMTVDKVLTWQVKRTQDAWLEQEAATKDVSTE
ncbi:MAG: hypothetical protein COB79_04010 [Zetaproteobacteria bacterium]|nr:MAG: hypothetical protein COB79_04010 [Zetaproteobacteria bacterium]